MILDLRDALGILIAALGGAAVGLEREWSGHASGHGARFAGIRTFTLLGLLAGMAGWLWSAGLYIVAALLLAGTSALIVAAYIAQPSASRWHDRSGSVCGPGSRNGCRDA